ncbi:MAG: S1/P1 nuclease [Alistipes sp.]|nr:S1/P1 nuclease [Alistipes sp.]
MRHLLTLLTSLCVTFSAFAWGQKGHDVVACIAEHNLSKSALKRITALLDGHSMVYVANWMDNASHTPEYEYTKTWHYVNVDPAEQTYANSQKEAKGDVVVAINNIISRIKSGELTEAEERVELMMLIHLVGDMHSPLHAGHKSDRGGNGTKVKYFGQQKKLHSLWDSDIVESVHRWSYSEWCEQLNILSPKAKRAIVQGTPNDWIEESVLLAADIYAASTTGENLSYDYVAHYTPIVEQQLLIGGLRLAAILEKLY